MNQVLPVGDLECVGKIQQDRDQRLLIQPGPQCLHGSVCNRHRVPEKSRIMITNRHDVGVGENLLGLDLHPNARLCFWSLARKLQGDLCTGFAVHRAVDLGICPLAQGAVCDVVPILRHHASLVSPTGTAYDRLERPGPVPYAKLPPRVDGT